MLNAEVKKEIKKKWLYLMTNSGTDRSKRNISNKMVTFRA